MTDCNKVYLMILFIGLIYVMNGCADQSQMDNENSIDEKKPYFAVLSKGYQHEFWQAVKTGSYQASNDYDVEITFDGPEGDAAISQQNEMIEKIIDKNPDVLIIAAVDSSKVIPSLEKVAEAGIPIIAFDSGVDNDLPLTTVATGNRKAASEAADYMASALSGEGEIGIICHDETSETGRERLYGFKDQIEANYPGIQIVDIRFGYGDHDISKKMVDEMLDEYPDLDGIFAANEGSAIGMLASVIEQGKENDLILIGYDAGKIQKEAVRQKVMIGAISQMPVEIGYKAVEAAYKVYSGESVPERIETGYFWYNSENVDDELLRINLYD